MTWWHLATAGLGPLIFHWGVGIGVIAVCILLEIFTEELGVIPVIGPGLVALLRPLRKDLLWIAATTGLCMFVYGIGVHDEKTRCDAKFSAANTAAVHRGTAARSRAVRTITSGVQHDPQDTDK